MLDMEEELQIVPMARDVEAQFVEMMVPLYSYGCANKIKKALTHFKGIYLVNVDYKQQKVTVWGICNKNEVLSTIRAKRKGARFWNQLQDDVIVIPSPSSSSSLRSFSLNWKAAWKKVFYRFKSF